VNDPRLQEISGLAAVDTGYLAVNDSNPDPSVMRIYRLDNQCKVTGTTAYPSDARDPEDIAVAPDGTVWVADTGDNDAKRTTVALWKLAPGEKTPVIHGSPTRRRQGRRGAADQRRRHADHRHQGGRQARHLHAERPLVARSNAGVPLKRVGQFDLPASQTSNPLGQIGRTVVSGGATAPDGKRVALRTYADAMEWDVPDGGRCEGDHHRQAADDAAAQRAAGRVDHYSRDGKTFITVSEVTAGRAAPLLRYTPAAPAAPAKSQAAAGGGREGQGRRRRLHLEPDDRRHHLPGGGRRRAGPAARDHRCGGDPAVARRAPGRRRARPGGPGGPGDPGNGPGGPGGGTGRDGRGRHGGGRRRSGRAAHRNGAGVGAVEPVRRLRRLRRPADAGRPRPVWRGAAGGAGGSPRRGRAGAAERHRVGVPHG
jgi:hypothetical protein